MSLEASGFKRAAFAESTKHCYQSHLRSYMRFCLFYSRVPVPVDILTLKAYAAFLARSIKPSSMGGYFNIIRLLHLERGYPNPLENNWELNMVRRGIARQLGVPPAQKLPITLEILQKMYDLVDLSLSHNKAFWAACLVVFFGLLRKSSLLPKSALVDFSQTLLRSDVIMMCQDSCIIQVRKSKTIQFGQRVLELPFSTCSNVALCPVITLLDHLTCSKLKPNMPLFSYVLEGSVYHITHTSFVEKLRGYLLRLGYPAKDYSGHSLRRGGCSLCYSAGMSTIDIKLRGDWKSLAFERYIFVSKEKKNSSAKLLSERASVLS